MMHQLTGIVSPATKCSTPRRKRRDRNRRWQPGLKQSGWIYLIVMGLFMSSPATSYAQVDPAKVSPVSGRSQTIEEIISADVLARVELLRDELELIRLEMGAPREPALEIFVTDVAPREVIYQAFTLFRKANRLRSEITRTPELTLQVKRPIDIRPFHVWNIVDAAYQVVHGGKQKLGITRPVEETLQDESITPTDVFLAIVKANREFDALYRRRLSAEDTFQQMVMATQFAAILLAEFPGAAQMPNIPAFEHGKRPVDVYLLLNQCYARIRAILEYSGIETLKLQIPRIDTEGDDSTKISASDVYDASILLVSELAHLQGQLKDTVLPVHQTYSRGIKMAAHVYQRGGLLLRQLGQLEKLVKKNPDWLTTEDEDASDENKSK